MAETILSWLVSEDAGKFVGTLLVERLLGVCIVGDDLVLPRFVVEVGHGMPAILKVGSGRDVGRGGGYAGLLFFWRKLCPLLFALGAINFLSVHFPPGGKAIVRAGGDDRVATYGTFAKEDAGAEEVKAELLDVGDEVKGFALDAPAAVEGLEDLLFSHDVLGLKWIHEDFQLRRVQRDSVQ